MTMIIPDLGTEQIERWGTGTVRARHTLAERPLFDDDSLADLIDRVDREALTISTMERGVRDFSDWHYCDVGDRSGHEVLEAVRKGRIWINFTHIKDCDSRFAELLDAMYDELEARVPGFRAFKRNIGLLISSPRADVIYHADIQGQALWQLRGRKRIWIYPPVPPFLEPAEFENVVRRVREEDLTYEEWFDEHAEVYDLEPGDMLHWRLNGPHKVRNHDSLNVSLTTQHWTKAIRRRFAVHYGNGLLREKTGRQPRSQAVTGPAFWTKAGMAVLWRTAGLQERHSFRRTIRYQVDPREPDGVRPVQA